MPENTAVQEEQTDSRAPMQSSALVQSVPMSLHGMWRVIRFHRRTFAVIVGSLLAACLIYCTVTPKVYEATARVALRGSTLSVLAADHNDSGPSGSFASGQVQLETLANVFRSDQLAWDVITRLRLYDAAGFMRSFNRRFTSFNPDKCDLEARAALLDEFQRRLTVQTILRTLVLQIRFRSHDAALSAAVVNTLVESFRRQDEEARLQSTKDATTWLKAQLVEFKMRADSDDRKLAEFQKRHGLLNAPETLGNGQATEVEHTVELSEVDALSRQLTAATTDRIVLEAAYRSAASGDPELVLASEPRLQAAGTFGTAILQQLHTRRSDLQQEQAQLRIEHGPNFPRVLEIRSQMEDVDAQIKAEDAKLVGRFRSAWKAASDREQLVRKSLNEASAAGIKLNEAALQVVRHITSPAEIHSIPFVGITSPQTCLVLQGRLRALREAGFRVSLLSAPGRLLYDTAHSEDAAAYEVPMVRGISPARDAIALFRIWRLLRRLRPDIVEFSTPKAGLLGSLAARICRVPVRIYFLRGLKLETSFGPKRILLQLTERIASACASVVVCNSQSLRNAALSLRITTSSKLVLLGAGSSNGVDLERYRPGGSDVRRLFGIPDNVPVIGFAGRLTGDKGIPELVDAFAAILREEPRARLMLVG